MKVPRNNRGPKTLVSLIPSGFGNVCAYPEQDGYCEKCQKGTQQHDLMHGYYSHGIHLLP